MKRFWPVALLAAALGAGYLALWLAAERQRPRGTDEAQIRALLVQAARAAQQRDAGAIHRLISDAYQDSLGLNAARARFEVSRVLRQYRQVQALVDNQSIQVQVEPDGKTARLLFQLTLDLRGPQGTHQSESTISLTLAKEPVRYFWLFPGAEWRVTSAFGYATDF